MGVLHALTASIDAKDPYTCGHSERVAMLSRLLAHEIGLPTEKVHQVYLSGLLHDVGKIGVPESVLCKVGKLDDEELAAIKLPDAKQKTVKSGKAGTPDKADMAVKADTTNK